MSDIQKTRTLLLAGLEIPPDAALMLLDRLEAAEKDAARYRWLIEQTGHWQDGSNTTVALFQDEATQECIVKIGETTRTSQAEYHSASTFNVAIDAAIAAGEGDKA